MLLQLQHCRFHLCCSWSSRVWRWSRASLDWTWNSFGHWNIFSESMWNILVGSVDAPLFCNNQASAFLRIVWTDCEEPMVYVALTPIMIIYRMVIVEGRCDQLTSSSLYTYIIIGWHKSIVSSDWSDTMVWFGQILLYLYFYPPIYMILGRNK